MMFLRDQHQLYNSDQSRQGCLFPRTDLGSLLLVGITLMPERLDGLSYSSTVRMGDIHPSYRSWTCSACLFFMTSVSEDGLRRLS